MEDQEDIEIGKELYWEGQHISSCANDAQIQGWCSALDVDAAPGGCVFVDLSEVKT